MRYVMCDVGHTYGRTENFVTTHSPAIADHNKSRVKPLGQNAYLQRYVRGDEDVDADVKLAAADEEGIIDVPLNHIRLGGLLRLLRLVVLTLILSLLRETKAQLDLETESRRRK